MTRSYEVRKKHPSLFMRFSGYFARFFEHPHRFDNSFRLMSLSILSAFFSFDLFNKVLFKINKSRSFCLQKGTSTIVSRELVNFRTLISPKRGRFGVRGKFGFFDSSICDVTPFPDYRPQFVALQLVTTK